MNTYIISTFISILSMYINVLPFLHLLVWYINKLWGSRDHSTDMQKQIEKFK